MSWKAVQAVIEQSRSRGSARALLLAIAYHADKQEFIGWPSIATLARESGNLSERRTFELLAELCRLNELSITGGRGGRGNTNLYRILLPPFPTAETLRDSAETLRDSAPFPTAETLRDSAETLRDSAETLRDSAVTYKAEPPKNRQREPPVSVSVPPHASVGQGGHTLTRTQPKPTGVISPGQTRGANTAAGTNQSRNVKTPLETPESWSGTPGSEPASPVIAVLEEGFPGFWRKINRAMKARLIAEVTNIETWRYVVLMYWDGPPHAVNMLLRYQREQERKGLAGAALPAPPRESANSAATAAQRLLARAQKEEDGKRS